jgi:hypothetical protein
MLAQAACAAPTHQPQFTDPFYVGVRRSSTNPSDNVMVDAKNEVKLSWSLDCGGGVGRWSRLHLGQPSIYLLALLLSLALVTRATEPMPFRASTTLVSVKPTDGDLCQSLLIGLDWVGVGSGVRRG